MSRRAKWTLRIGGSLLGLIVLAVAAAVFLAQSSWLREQVRQRIVTEAETATGGTVEIASFEFDWPTLTARVNGFVVHGTEPAGAPPLLRVQSITVQLKVISFLKKLVDVRSVDAVAPEARLIINPDGTTNVPQPKEAHAGDKNPVATILDLAIGRFSVHDGMFQVNSQRTPWNAAGEKLRAQLVYNRAKPSYAGNLSIQPLHFTAAKDLPVEMTVNISLVVEKNKLTVSSARLETAHSHADLSGSMDSFSSPEYRLNYTASVSLEELVHTLRFRARPEGILQVSGTASFRDFGHYLLAGKLAGDSLSFGQGKVQVHGMRAESEFRLDPQQIDLTNARLAALGGHFNGRARIVQLDRIRVDGEASDLDLQRLAQAFAVGALPWDGVLSGAVDLTGLISELNQGRFTAHAQLVVSPASPRAPVHGVIDAHYDGYRDSVDLGQSFLQLPSTRLDFTGTLDHQLHVRLQSTDLNDLLPALQLVSSDAHPTLPVELQKGSAAFNGTLTGPFSSPQIAGHAALQNFTFLQDKIDSFAADVAIHDSGLRLQNGSLARGSLRAQFAGAIGLRNWKPDTSRAFTASASFHGGDLHDLLRLAAPDIPAAGSLSGSAQLSGSLDAPHLAADVAVTQGSLYGEPFDRFAAHILYTGNSAAVSNAKLTAGETQLTLGATYTHAPHDLLTGKLTFEAASNRAPLDQFQHSRLPDLPLAGNVQITAKGAGEIARTKTSSAMFRLTELHANIDGRQIQLALKPIGDVHLTAVTTGSTLTAQLQSAVANSVIHADGQWRLVDDYPGAVQVTFTKLDVASLESWLGLPASSLRASGFLEGKATVSGPALKPAAWSGALEIPRLEIGPLPGDVAGSNPDRFALHNQDPIRLSLQKSVLHVEAARLTGQATDVTLTGNISLEDRDPLDLHLDGNVDLATLQDFSRDLLASGKLTANATIHGPLSQPLVVGKVELQNANLNLKTFPNGLSNANGVILFTGDRATIQQITAESGGGKVTITGFATERGKVTDLHLDVAAEQVRLRYPEGVSTLANAKLTWIGTSQRSLVSGTVTILRTGFTPRTDFASILASSNQPVRVPAVQTGLLAGVNFDIQIETSPGVLVQSELAQQVQADANLRLRGTANNPALLGRINITQGQLTFFGSKYTISQGSISFFSAVKIDPIVNVDLQTKARGVDVTITLSGPMNKLNVTYRSDPPLQFADIVALLATGRAPQSDPTLAASQAGNAQTWQQLGASALVGQALASPASDRLQRFFGVSNIKIDPTLTGITNPQARLTIEQQVTPDITFTYITYLTQSNPQVVQVEWSLSKQLSLVALRDENGLFGVDFYIKKRFK